jgi:hypothetical protein
VQWEVDVDRVLEARVRLSEERYGDQGRADAYWAAAVERLEALPDVELAAVTGFAVAPRGTDPPGDGASAFGSLRVRAEPLAISGGVRVRRSAVDPAYFKALGLPLLEGPGLAGAVEGGALEVVVSRRFAEAAWPGERALGQVVDFGEGSLQATVVGLVDDQLAIQSNMRGARLDRDAAVYFARTQVSTGAESLVIRTRRTAEDAIEGVAEALRAVDPMQPVLGVETLRSVREGAVIVQTVMMGLLGPFALCGLGVALMGLYGLVSYEVEQRRREMSIRAALGAAGGTLLRLAVGESVKLCALGLAAGAALAYGGVKLFGAFLLFEAPGVSVAAYLGAAGLVLGATLLATAVPARRAVRVSPVEALKQG